MRAACAPLPELPDVETLRRYFSRNALGERIAAIEVRAPSLLEAISPRALRERIEGRRFTAARRHGKYLFAAVQGGGALVLHFGMTGWLYYLRSREQEPRFTRLLIRFARDARLAYDNMRMFGLIGWADDVAAYVRARGLGPDALKVSASLFRGLLRGRRGGLKALLMDQRTLAGIGNLYADEILFQAGLHPAGAVERLRPAQVSRLYRSLLQVLRIAVKARADATRMPRRFLLRTRGPKGRCPRCGRVLERATIAGRTTYYCKRDQRLP
jgi:formamidopyrimidine-DNA glycosylase